MSVKQISIRTAANGSYTYERAFEGVVYGIELQIGTLSTPDIDVSDGVYLQSLLSVNGVAADTMWQPGRNLQNAAGTALQAGSSINSDAPSAIMGTLKVEITGAGDTKRGTVRILYQ
jgi:hypothetical protein